MKLIPITNKFSIMFYTSSKEIMLLPTIIIYYIKKFESKPDWIKWTLLIRLKFLWFGMSFIFKSITEELL